jgi:hypothetical protein
VRYSETIPTCAMCTTTERLRPEAVLSAQGLCVPREAERENAAPYFAVG